MPQPAILVRMYTQCPDCLTVFSLGADTLSTAGGHVQCGHCEQMFDALACLAAQLPPEPFTRLAAPVPPGPTPRPGWFPGGTPRGRVDEKVR